jgi:hypothetical protein
MIRSHVDERAERVVPNVAPGVQVQNCSENVAMRSVV